MHCLFWHMNSPVLHVLLNTERKRNNNALECEWFTQVLAPKPIMHVITHHSRPSRSRRLRPDSLCLRHTPSAAGHTCRSRDSETRPHCTSYSLSPKHTPFSITEKKITLIYDADKCLRSYSPIHQSHFEMSYFMLFLRLSTHCICCPHLFHLHSHPSHHTPSCWKYSDDSCTQTVSPSRTYLSRIIKWSVS